MAWLSLARGLSADSDLLGELGLAPAWLRSAAMACETWKEVVLTCERGSPCMDKKDTRLDTTSLHMDP